MSESTASSGNEAPERSANITSTSVPSDSRNIFTDSVTNNTFVLFVILIGVFFLFFILSFVYIVVTRLRHEASSKKISGSKDSEENTIYQNTSTEPSVRKDESMKTHMFRQLPPLPVVKKLPLATADVEESAYLLPSSPFYSLVNEIKSLPPAPPVFPKYLGNLQLEGEGSYMPVVSDEEAKLYPPSSPSEISPDDNSLEMCEESGYVQPKKIRKISAEASSSKTECLTKLKSVKDNELQKSKKVSLDTTAQRVLKNVQDIPKCKPYTDEDVSEMKSESSNNEKAKRFRSTLQINLTPPTRPRSIPVPTRKATLVLCVRTDY
jgi:hypothetical protein